MRNVILLSIAGILTAAAAVQGQYTLGTGGTYVGPSTPILPAPGQPGYQPIYQPQPAPMVAGQPVRVVQGQTVVVAQLSDAQMADLTASIALYPDALLAEMFPATTFIEELTYADRWQDQHPGADENAINALPVDDSVKGIMHYPAVMDMLVGHLDWSQALGLAFTYQRQDLMESIQRWRATAVAAGNLYSTPQQEVLQAGTVIMIQPQPQVQVVYVPVYDPAVVYVRPALGRPRPVNVITFGGPGFSLTFMHNDVDWRAHEIRVPRRDDRVFISGGGDRPGGRAGGGGGPAGRGTWQLAAGRGSFAAGCRPGRHASRRPERRSAGRGTQDGVCAEGHEAGDVVSAEGGDAATGQEGGVAAAAAAGESGAQRGRRRARSRFQRRRAESRARRGQSGTRGERGQSGAGFRRGQARARSRRRRPAGTVGRCGQLALVIHAHSSICSVTPITAT
jgi:hypothetical protein